MSKVFIRNGIVNMPWEADGFFESKKNGFLGACHVYSGEKGDIAVMFSDKHAYILLDVNDEPAGVEDYFEAVKEANKAGSSAYVYFEDVCIEFSNGVESDDDVLAIYGLSHEDGEDMCKRLEDLSAYWQEIVVDL